MSILPLYFAVIIFTGIAALFTWFRSRADRPAIVPLKSRYKKVLKASFPYYQRLPAALKGKFERRVQAFITSKEFISRSRKIPVVTNEMKALIAASAVQLTFGLPRVTFVHFKRIVLYQDDYYSNISKLHHKGETNPMYGIIVLSWSNFMSGLFHHDGINLGLHEMAHALRLENSIRNSEYNFIDKAALQEWDTLALQKLAIIRSGKNQFLRDYGGANEEELFAVSVEAFFEMPAEYRDNLPRLYYAMTRLLNQDPLVLQGHAEVAPA